MGKLRSCFYPILFVFAALSIANGDVIFRFSTIYGDHMVLQQAPKRAIVWGYGEVGQNVKLWLSDKVYETHVYPRNEGGEEVGVWQVALQPMNDSGPHFINASSYVKEKLKIITLDDVLFGDVWMCTGQSNMQFTLDMSDDGKEAINDSTHYPEIRLFSAGLDCSVFQRKELCKIELPWSVASPETVNGHSWGYFSAVCWYYGVQLYKTLKYPIGLISSSFEGSPIESWSSHNALNQCGWLGEFLNTLPDSGITELSTFPLYSCIWNSMIMPFLNMTIHGAIFYQGETNAMNPKILVLPYNCTFPAMINDWRAKWHASTQNNTDPQFPFGFVQLSAVNYSKSSLHFAQLRWDQTAQKGYAPNAQLQNTFMAVTMDLGNPLSPYTSIHPTDKFDVGYRLALSGLSLVYG